uniref:Uncharacterized protein n=1 Tax=Octopus bimaculoides TaxID=37653 RepID=A0A0L8FNL5_OCTBM
MDVNIIAIHTSFLSSLYTVFVFNVHVLLQSLHKHLTNYLSLKVRIPLLATDSSLKLFHPILILAIMISQHLRP